MYIEVEIKYIQIEQVSSCGEISGNLWLILYWI